MNKIRSAFAATAAAAMLAAGTITALSAPPAEAAVPIGRACLFLDIAGAKGAGHTAWALRNPQNRKQWIWGSIEGSNPVTIPAGKPNGSKLGSGTWESLRASFVSPRRYEYYRCINTAGGSLKAAKAKYQQTARNGYDLRNNNCLTKPIAIFRSYSTAFTPANLPGGAKTPPNYYFKVTLDHARGWEQIHSY
ncbi:Tat pathway signal protein [Streptomyces ipomoeae]|uniref:Tat pathway signal protein n=1 Tax=Streptomyces ipomoeae TaxID=103232 RepID=UPI0011477335|nr:Tat pathway signal protein [Streptomyces ipomoeae]MDX2828484.1 Tat pathway signal protein [Streptomyces ipomoeae]MDX2880974.1 Tat pathway signal protein [Streptomyces ipomoeae]MDX2939537.1 Tat pathway signal protein [Streptomyces ipomoeae]TQE27967.1 Tat pathway signal protein [Streptomyces ipomoeae]